MPIAFEPGESVERMAEMQGAAREMITNLQLDENLARGATQLIETSIAARREKGADGKLGPPKAMDALELAHMEALLQQRFGDQYDAKITAMELAFRAAGPKAEWLRRAVLHSGPSTAVFVIESMARAGARLTPGAS